MGPACLRAIALALVLLAALTPFQALAEKPKKQILYLNSYHNGYKWSDNIFKGVQSVLSDSAFNIELQVEYLDAKRYDYQALAPKLRRFYAQKFEGEKFDVIMVSDDDAFEFIKKYRDELFPGVPLVFSGINDARPKSSYGANMTGVVELFDLHATLDVALEIHPHKRRMIVVSDESTAGSSIKRQVEMAMPFYPGNLEVEFWNLSSLVDFTRQVGDLDPDTFLFFIPSYQLVDGRIYTAEEVITVTAKHTNVPIYSCWEFLMGHGVLGGKVLSGEDHGREAAKMALRLIQGESVDNIPVVAQPSGKYLFDYRLMKSLGIKQGRLPKGSLIINSPKKFYEMPKEFVWTTAVSIFVLLVIVIFLMVVMTERRKAGRKVRDQLAFQETLMDAIPQLISWKDHTGKYTGANRSFTRFFGLEHNRDIIGKTSIEVSGDNAYSRWASQADISIMQGKGPFRKKQQQLMDAKGQPAWIEINKVPLYDQSGKISGVLSTAENVTKEKNLEQQLLQSQKVEAIDTLAGGIAHDFNNILTSIINSTELAVGDLEEGTVVHKDLKRVLKAAQRGSRVVKQILAFSRPSKEGFKATDVGQVISEVVGLIESSTPSNIKTSFHVDRGLAPVMADPNQLHQVIMNLCTNAFQAQRATGGRIDVQVTGARLTQERSDLPDLKPGDYVRICVSDRGPGIDQEIRDKIFDPFFTTKDKTEGTGLGLAVVHGIIKGHDGGIRVLEQEGRGARFEVFLPQADAQDIENQELAPDKTAASGAILFVEDDADQLHTTPRLLKDMGYDVTSRKAAQSAAKLVARDPDRFNLVITDYDMPEMSGTQLAEELAVTAPDIPIILVSGREDASAAAKGLANIKGVIIKPYDKNDLAAAIAAVLQKE